MISKLVSRLNPSATVEIQETLAQLTARGVDIVKLNAGEPDMPTPAHIVDAGIKALSEGKTRYTPAAGILPLREAIAAKLKHDNGLLYGSSQIVVTTGAKQAIVNGLMSVLDPGDEVIILTPAWVSYPDMVKIAGGVPVLVPTKADYQPDSEAIERALTARTKMLLVNSPNNPTGAVYTDDSLRDLANLAVRHNLWVLTDEIYEKLVFNGKSHASIIALQPALAERAILVNGFSKSYAMTGWRAGYLAAPQAVAKAATTLAGHMTSNVTTFVQWACLAALEGGDACVDAMRDTFAARQRLIADGLNALPGFHAAPVDGAFYLMPNVEGVYGKKVAGTTIESSLQLAKALLDEAHVAVIPGEAFFAPGTLRFSYCSSEDDIREGLARIRHALTGDR